MFSRPARVARGFVAAGTSTLIAALSHAAGGGVFPHPSILLFGVLFSGLICIALTGRRISLMRIIPSVLGSQVLFHLLFAMTPGASVPMGSGHSHGGVMLMTAETGSPGMMLDAAIISAHLAAAGATIVALRFGEAAFWDLFDTARLMLASAFRFALLTLAVIPSTPEVPAADVAFTPVLAPPFLTCIQHRGPPTAHVLV